MLTELKVKTVTKRHTTDCVECGRIFIAQRGSMLLYVDFLGADCELCPDCSTWANLERRINDARN